MRTLVFPLIVLIVVAATVPPASAQRFTRSGLRGGSSISSLRRPSRIVAPAAKSRRLAEKWQPNAGRLSPGRMTDAHRQLGLVNKLGERQIKVRPTLEAFRDRMQTPGISGMLKDRKLAKERQVGPGGGKARGVIIIRDDIFILWRPLWWRPYPFFVPLPPRPGPVPICVQGSDSPVVVQSPVQDTVVQGTAPDDTHARPEDPPRPDLAIILAHCPLPTVMAGQDVGPVLQVAAACLSTDRVDDVAIDVYVTTDPNPLEKGRQATYSSRFSDGVLLKGGREVVSFPGNGLLNVPMTGALTIPADTPAGDYYLGVAIDAADRVAEADETNNIQFVPLRVIAAGQSAP